MRESKIEVGSGTGKGADAFAVGANAAQQAVKDINHPLSAVLVFASVRHDLERLLQGIHSVVGEVQVLGATTAGEICDSSQQESVVVVALASPYLNVRVGTGHKVSDGWQQAVAQAVSAPAVTAFFSPQDGSLWPELTRQGKTAFAIMFSPGNTRHADSRSYETLEELKRLSGGRLPIFGGSSADDWQMETNYVLLGQHAYPDSMLVAVFETQLRFGVGLAHGFQPGPQRATITHAEGHEILELDSKPAAQVYAQMLGSSQEALKGKHLTLTSGRPAGTPDPHGQYSITVASYFTDRGGVRFSQPVSEGTVLSIMEADKDTMVTAGREALRKALLRGEIIDPSIAFVCSCALRTRILGERTGEELVHMKEIAPDTPLVGFYSFGEQGLADDGINRHNNEVVTVLALGQELSYAAQVALENERLHEALQESEERFRILVESMDDVIFTLDREQRHTGVFGHWVERAGLTPETFLGKTSREILGNEAAAVHEAANERALAGEHVVYEWSVPVAEGTQHYQTSLSPIRDASGAVTGIVGVGRDITDRKQAEEALGKREQEFKTLVEHNPDMIARFDRECRHIYVNPAVEQELGVPPAALLGKTHSETGMADEQATWSEGIIRHVFESGQELFFETDVLTSEGIKHYLTRGVPEFAQDGSIASALFIHRNVTRRKQAEEEQKRLLAQIQEQAQRMQQIMDTVPEGVILLDANNQIILANPVARRELAVLANVEIGDTITHLGNRPLTELLTPPPQGLWHEVAADSPSPQIFEVIAQPTDMTTSETGPKPGGWVLVIRDVTREREVEQRIHQRERLATVGQLAAGVAHDFNNILASIVLYAQMTARSEELSDRNRERMMTINQQAQNASQLIQQLLDFARRAVLERRPLELAALLKDHVELLKRTLPESIEIELSHEADEYMVDADPARLQQMVTNLALNARDAMPQGGSLRFEIQRTRVTDPHKAPLPEMKPGEWIQLTVSDTGVGIPPDVLPRIFEPFFTTRAPLGSGLGLSQVHGIVAQHEGQIDVESQEGQGTIFTIYLPALATPTSETPDAGLSTKRTALPTGQGETILVVEDDDTVRKALTESLELLNYQVVEVKNGHEALGVLGQRREEIALVLSDVVMPTMGGVALLHALQEQALSVRVVMLSGHSPPEDALDDLRKQGMTDWMPKPPSLEKLAEIIARALATD